MTQKLYKGKVNITVRLTPEQVRIFEEAASITGFRDTSYRTDYLLYLMARDLTPMPGVFDYARGQLKERLKATGPHKFRLPGHSEE